MRLSAAGRVVLVAGLVAAVLPCCARPAPAGNAVKTTQATPATQLTAAPVPPDPRVGAVFLGGTTMHTCTGGVLNSPSGNLIITAAHCVAGGIDTGFVVGFNNQAAPEEIWHVDAVYLDPRWVANQDPMADFAVARVSRDAGGTILAQAGGGLALAQAPKPGTVVTITGYGYGVGGGPVGCRAATGADTKGFPALACGGIVAGLSGAPWIVDSTVIGVVGGLDGGGCDDNLSYTAPFDDAITRLLARAEAGGAADDAPTVFEDTCS